MSPIPNGGIPASGAGIWHGIDAAGFGAGGDELSDDAYSDVYTPQTGDYTQAS